MSRTATARRWDPDALAALEHERGVLLRELRELDEQRRTGEVTPEQHAVLSDELTERAAEVIERIERGRARRPERSPSKRVRATAVAGIALAALVAGWLLTGQLAPRVPPAPPAAASASTLDARTARLAQVVERRPDDVPARMALARLLLQQQDLPAALEQFDAAAATDPSNAEALAYGGWVAVLTGGPDGLSRLDRAVEADPAYPDAHALHGLALMRAGEEGPALEELRRYLELAPEGPMAGQVEAVITRLGGRP